MNLLMYFLYSWYYSFLKSQDYYSFNYYWFVNLFYKYLELINVYVYCYMVKWLSFSWVYYRLGVYQGNIYVFLNPRHLPTRSQPKTNPLSELGSHWKVSGHDAQTPVRGTVPSLSIAWPEHIILGYRPSYQPLRPNLRD